MSYHKESEAQITQQPSTWWLGRLQRETRGREELYYVNYGPTILLWVSMAHITNESMPGQPHRCRGASPELALVLAEAVGGCEGREGGRGGGGGLA